jgi:crotonobetaine/carnitine-CoA ligase
MWSRGLTYLEDISAPTEAFASRFEPAMVRSRGPDAAPRARNRRRKHTVPLVQAHARFCPTSPVSPMSGPVDWWLTPLLSHADTMVTPFGPHCGKNVLRADATPSLAVVLWHRAIHDRDGEIVRRAGGAPWTAGELWGAAASVAGEFQHRVSLGDVVATATDTGPEALVISAAISAIGAVELPLAPDMSPEWATRLMVRTRAVALLATPARATPLVEASAVAAKVPISVIDPDATHAQPTSTDLRPVLLEPTDPALIMTTSGTNGRTKAALLPVGAPIGQARRVARAMAYGPDDVLLSTFAWHHINARHACFLPALISGARVVVAPGFSASRFFEVARTEGATAFNFMGAMCRMLLAQPPSDKDRDHRIRAAYGGPAPADLVVTFRDRFGVTLRQAYACTELGDVAVTAVDELRTGAAGRVVEDYEVRVVDEEMRPVPAGQAGELLVKPRRDGLAFREYVGDEQSTRDAWYDGWFRTRDRGRLADGWLWIDGRLGDVIRRRGVNIDPHHVEEALAAHPDVVEAAAVAVPSELTEDEVLAVAVPAAGKTLDAVALWDHCRLRLPRHMVPRFISVEPALPHNRSLKVDRAALRQRGLPENAWDAEARTPTRQGVR